MSNFRFCYCYAGKVSDTADIALTGNVDYISSAILLEYVNSDRFVSVWIWPDELKGSIPELLTDYMAFVKFCNKALQEDKYD